MTLPQVAETLGAWAYKSGIRKAYTMVSDFGPGQDAEGAFQRAFKAAGGEIVGSVRLPVANPDFSAFVQRAKDLNPESIFIFVPGGAQPRGARQGVRRARHRSQEDQGPRHGRDRRRGRPRKSMGDAALGIITAWHYDYNDDSTLNKEFVAGLQRGVQAQPRTSSRSAATTACTLIYEALKKTGGKTDGDSLIAAAKGMAGKARAARSPIDPETRDIVQNIYIRRVEKVGGKLRNVEFDKVENVKDPAQGRDEEVGDRAAAIAAGQAAVMLGPMFGVLFDGFAYGMLLFLLSVGLSVTLGMMNFVNLAHCSFAMLGGYVTVTLMNSSAGRSWRRCRWRSWPRRR